MDAGSDLIVLISSSALNINASMEAIVCPIPLHSKVLPLLPLMLIYCDIQNNVCIENGR